MPRLELTHLVLHHTAAEEKDTEQIRNYHKSKGWQDIGYDYVIEKDGKTVEGRSLSIQGAHAGVTYYNQHAVGIAIIGNLSKREIYAEQLSSLVALLYQLLTRWNIPLENILLHKEIKSTECPGSYFPKETVLNLLAEKMLNETPETLGDLQKKLEYLQQSLQAEKEEKQQLQKRVDTLSAAITAIKTIIQDV